MAGGIIKLRLIRAIILNDVARMDNGQRPIKWINRLALLIDTRYGDDYEYDRIRDVMYKAQKTGYSQHDKVEWIDGLVDKICEVLDTKRDDLIQEIERWQE